MIKTIITLSFGVLIGFAMSRWMSQAAPATRIAQETSQRTNLDVAKNDNSVSAKLSQTTEHEAQKKAIASLDAESEKSMAPAPPRVRKLTLNVSSEQISAMEKQISELRNEISLLKDSEGWGVRIHQNSALISSLGLQDNDYIRFSQFQELKRSPATEGLVSRLEAIFTSLED